MNKVAGPVFLVSVLVSSFALAAEPPPPPVEPPAEEKKFGLGADAQLSLPVGGFADTTGFGGGAFFRAQYAIHPYVSPTLRAGLVLHSSKSFSAFGTSISLHAHELPIVMPGAKFFVLGTSTGPYAATELGLVNLSAGASGAGTGGGNSKAYLGMTLGGGYEFGPWDIRFDMRIAALEHAGDSITLNVGGGYTFAAF